ncbi:MAG: DUF6445 family protein [Novosphingobium sp.]
MTEVSARLDRLGRTESPVVTLDGLSADWAGLIQAAAALAPLPPAAGIYYPGLRRILCEADAAAWGRCRHLLELAAPYVAGGFDCDGFDLVEANFSLVTTAPQQLVPAQRHPHFDSTDPDWIALIAYLFGGEEDSGGTAFFRHQATGIEVVDDASCARFVSAAQVEAPVMQGYFSPGDPFYEPIGAIAARFGRVGIWRGHLLHSGVIGPQHNFSPDPRAGRLTLNLFLKLKRN